MPKTIIILDQVLTENGPGYNVLLWADVPAAKQPFWSGQQSQSAWSGASAAENTAIASGAVREKRLLFVPPSGWTNAQLRALLVTYQAQWQTDVTADTTYGRYGTFYDGTTWTAGGA